MSMSLNRKGKQKNREIDISVNSGHNLCPEAIYCGGTSPDKDERVQFYRRYCSMVLQLPLG